jgi:hypothetical protein
MCGIFSLGVGSLPNILAKVDISQNYAITQA